MFDEELKGSDFQLAKHSELKTIKNISFVSSDKHLADPEKIIKKPAKPKNDESKVGAAEWTLETVANLFPWDIFFINVEILILVGIAALLILMFFFFWAFITIPLILLVLGFLSLGDAWRMLHVYSVQFRPDVEIDMFRMVRNIHSQGGIISKNWRNRITSTGLKIKADKIRRNYVKFMRSVCVTSYSLFILATLVSIEHFFGPFGDTFMLFIWLFFGILAIFGFMISIFSLIERRKLRNKMH